MSNINIIANLCHQSASAPVKRADESICDENVFIDSVNKGYIRKTNHFKLLESVVINSPSGVIITANPNKGVQPEIIYTNRAMQEMSGYPIEELIGNHPSILRGKGTDKYEYRRMVESIERNDCFNSEIKFFGKTGTHFWVNITITPIFNTSNQCTHFVAILSDITQRRLAEKESRRANERYEILSNATNEAMWDWNISTNNILWSHAITNVFGYDEYPERVTDFNWWKNRIHPNDRERVIEQLNDVLSLKGSMRVDEYDFLCKSGIYKRVYDRSLLIYDEKTNLPVRMIGSLQDVSELRNKEKKVMEQNHRINDIAQINSHVIRRPVANLLGLIQIIDKRNINLEDLKIIDFIETNVIELDKVIHDIANKSNEEPKLLLTGT